MNPILPVSRKNVLNNIFLNNIFVDIYITNILYSPIVMDKLVITERPTKWNKTQYTVVTLNDLTGESLDKLIKTQFSFILVDETVKNEDILMFQKESEYLFTDDVIIPLLKDYSIFIRPQILTSVRHDSLLYQGIFRFENNMFYDIYSKNPLVDLNDFFTDKSGIILVQSPEPEEPVDIAAIQASTKVVKPAETVVVMIRKLVDYDAFNKNMDIFNEVIAVTPLKTVTGIQTILKNEKIKNSDYLNDLFSKIVKKYQNQPFPYDSQNPFNIYFVIILHNQLLRDLQFKKRAKDISQNIGALINGNGQTKYKGIVIQSVAFLPIKGYDPVELFKITNDDNYYIWMKNENTNGPKQYELRIKDPNYIRENKVDLKRIKKGGTRKKYKYERS